jgi:hypothetical protein
VGEFWGLKAQETLIFRYLSSTSAEQIFQTPPDLSPVSILLAMLFSLLTARVRHQSYRRYPHVAVTVDAKSAATPPGTELLCFTRIRGRKPRYVPAKAIRHPNPILLINAEIKSPLVIFPGFFPDFEATNFPCCGRRTIRV